MINQILSFVVIPRHAAAHRHFHAERWDYVYIYDRPGKPREQRHLSVFFEEGRLARLGGDVVAMPGNVREVQ